MMVPESPADLPVAAPANDSGGELQRERVEATNVAAPVAAPDPADTMPLLTIHGAALYAMAEGEPEDAAHITAILARRLREQAALLAERQQDKERIERLEAAVSRYEIHLGIARSFIPAARNQTYLARVDEALDRRAALAVEEDAPEQNVTEGMPPELVRALRDPTIRLPQDDYKLADGRSIWEHLEEWRNAPSNTASGAAVEEDATP